MTMDECLSVEEKGNTKKKKKVVKMKNSRAKMSRTDCQFFGQFQYGFFCRETHLL
jgi:hypothetical protein